MNRNYVFIVMIFVVIFMLGFSNIKSTQTTTTDTSSDVRTKNCLAEDCLLVDGLEYPVGTLPSDVKLTLDTALDDEYKAYSTYQAIIDKLGSARPFSMIIDAEEAHIAQLKSLYSKYGETPITNQYLGKIVSPSTLIESCRAGVDAEVANGDLYETRLLPIVTEYPDISQVFTNLMNASIQKHLPAFERCSGR